MELPIEITPLWQWWGIWNAFKSFFNQVSTRDFSILKWVLIALPIIWILIIIYFFISWKLRVLDNWTFWQWYWLRLVTGAFWIWKTKEEFQSAYLWKKENPDWVLISNLKYDFVDIPFNSKKDFDFIMKDIVQYIRDTNNFDELKKDFDFPPIKIIVDEAHLYLFAREFKSFTKDLLLVLTQCRKREISIDFITQELWQIDVFIRRLCPYIEYLSEGPVWLTKKSIFYCLDADTTSMRNEESFEEVESVYLLPFKRGPSFRPVLKWFYEQRFLTAYVIWWEDIYSTTESEDEKYSYKYNDFKSLMDSKIKSWRTPLPPKKTIFDSLFKKDDDLQQKIIEEQKKKIDALIKLIPESELESVFGPSPLSSLKTELNENWINNDFSSVNNNNSPELLKT